MVDKSGVYLKGVKRLPKRHYQCRHSTAGFAVCLFEKRSDDEKQSEPGGERAGGVNLGTPNRGAQTSMAHIGRGGGDGGCCRLGCWLVLSFQRERPSRNQLSASGLEHKPDWSLKP